MKRVSFLHHINNKGVALLITLAVISVLMVALFELVSSSGGLSDIQQNMADRIQAEEIARSGIELAMFILTRDAQQNEIDSLQEMWADPELLSFAVQLLGFDDHLASLDLVITDELGKIQLNALLTQFPGNLINTYQSALWERFLNLIISSDKSVDLRDPAEIINSIKDWLDSGDDDAISGLSGAESDYYEALDPPVVCSNAPLNKVEELFMIKGVPENLMAMPENLISEKLIDTNYNSESQSASTDLDPSKIFTVYGIDSSKKEGSKFTYPGTININTADEIVLAAMLPVGMEDQASELANFRIEKDQNGETFTNALDSGWYKKVISLSPKDAQEFEKIVRYSSDLFRVDALSKFNGVEFTLTGFIKREQMAKNGKWGCTILQLTGN